MVYEPLDGGQSVPSASSSPTVRYRVIVVLLLVAPLAFLSVALVRPAWRELYTETATEPGVTFQGLRIGSLDICLRNRVDPAVAANTSLGELHGEHCYSMRKPTRIPLLNSTLPSKVEWLTFALCDTRGAEDSMPDNGGVQDYLFFLRDALEGMGVPKEFLSDTATVVNVACVYLPLLPLVMAFAGVSLTCFLSTLYFKPSLMREGFETGAAVLAAGSAVLLVANLLLWKTKAASFGVAGGGMYLALTSTLMLLFVAAAMMTSSRHSMKRREERQGQEEVHVSPRATERLI